jgi:hypothetical protein
VKARLELLRGTLALLGAGELVALVVALHRLGPAARSSAHTPGFLLAFGEQPPLAFGVALAGGAALALFALGRSPRVSGVVALAALGTLVEAHAALLGGPMRVFFHTGAALFGWCLGALCTSDGETRDAFGRAGATGAVAATYLGAAASKWLSGLDTWLAPGPLQAVVLSQHRVGGGSVLDAYARFVGGAPKVALALAAVTLVIQAGAFLMLFGPRLRAAWAALLLGFHVNVWLLTGIVFPQAMVLLLVLGAPARSQPSLAGARPAPVRVLAAALAVGVALLVAAAVQPGP